MTTSLQRPSARKWLADLDRELRKLPPQRAEELRSELVAHADQTITPEDSEERVREALAALGTPAELVGEELGGAKPRSPWHRLRRRTRVLLIVGIICAATAVTVAVAATRKTAPAALTCACAMIFPLDRNDGSVRHSRAGDNEQS